jgi:hypothetical protein
MDELHSVLRSLRQGQKAQKPRRDHLTVFREFLSHLDRVSKDAGSRDVKALRRPRGRKRRIKS